MCLVIREKRLKHNIMAKTTNNLFEPKKNKAKGKAKKKLNKKENHKKYNRQG